jgi:acyl carrier protein
VTDAQLRAAVLAALAGVAPEVEEIALDPGQTIRDQLDIDSMDFLNFMMALNQTFGIEVPEQDYAEVASLNGCVRYLAHKLARP